MKVGEGEREAELEPYYYCTQTFARSRKTWGRKILQGRQSVSLENQSVFLVRRHPVVRRTSDRIRAYAELKSATGANEPSLISMLTVPSSSSTVIRA